MRAEEVHEEDRRRVRDIGEVRRKGETAQEKSSRSQVSGGGHCYVTKLFLFNPKSQQL